MDFDDFIYEIKQMRQKRVPFINDYLEDYDQSDMEARAEAQGEVFNMAFEAMSITKAPALARMSIHDEAYVEDYGSGANLIFDDDAFEPYSELVKKLYTIKKRFPEKSPLQREFPFAAKKKDRIESYNKYAIETIKNLDDDIKFDEYAYDDCKDLHYKNINKTYERLDDIEDKFKEAVNRIWDNDSTWHEAAVAGMMEDYILTDEDDAKEKFIEWVFEDM